MATYFIDYVAGSDSNSGTSTGSPWKRLPYMAGWAGSYSHSAGDIFRFKGGVTWPASCFPVAITAGGSSTVRDIYGVDVSWYTGGAWTKPVFDFEHTVITGGYAGSGFQVVSVGYVTIDSLELKNHRSPFSTFANVTLLLASAHDVTVTNCYLHDWDLPGDPTGATGSQDAGGGIFFVDLGSGGGANLLVDGNELTQSGVTIRSGIPISLSGVITNNHIHHACFGLQSQFGYIGQNHLHAMVRATDPSQHGAVIITAHSIVEGNWIHDATTIGEVIECDGSPYGVGTMSIINNLVYDTTPNPIDLITASTAQTVNVYNNTIVSGGSILNVSDHGGNIAVLNVRNNHFLTSSATPLNYNNPGIGGGPVGTDNVDHNQTQSVTAADAVGYNLANLFQPTSSSSPTVDAGVDLSSVLTTDRLGVTRTVPFDIGAYEFNVAVPTLFLFRS